MLLLNDPAEINETVISRSFGDVDHITLYPFVDFHLGDKSTDVAAGKRFIKAVKDDPNAYLLYLGDNMNNATKSSVSNVYRECMNPHEQKKALIDMLEPVADRFLCFVPGNHEQRSAKESDAELVWDIADRLGRRDVFRPNIAFLDLTVGFDSHANKANHYRGCGLHGAGGGKKPGSMVNNLEDFAYSIEGLDFIACGHTHKRASGRPGKLVFPQRGGKMIQRDFLTYIAAPWGYWGGYAARGMFRPSTLGVSPITLSGKRRGCHTVV